MRARSPTPGSRWPTSARSWPGAERRWLWWSAVSPIAQLLPPFPKVPWGRSAIATPLILLGAIMSVLCYFEWKANQRALRLGAPLGRSQLPKILACTITVIALLAGAVEIYSKVASR